MGKNVTCFNSSAVGVNICSASLGQDDVVSEVSDLHLLEVKDLLLAVFAGDLLKLVAQALQHRAATGLLYADTAACIGALLGDGLMASCAQPEIQPAGQRMAVSCCDPVIGTRPIFDVTKTKPQVPASSSSCLSPSRSMVKGQDKRIDPSNPQTDVLACSKQV